MRAFVLVLLAMALAGPLVSQPQHDSGDAYEDARGEKEAPAPAASALKPPSSTPGEAHSSAYARNQELQSSPEWGTYRATVALDVITFVLACVTAGLWLATLRLARDAKATADRQAADTRESLTIATRAADATSASVALSENTAKRQLRAYLSRRGMARHREPATGDWVAFDFRPLIVNAGATPAHDVVYRGVADAFAGPPGPEVDFSFPTQPEMRIGTLGPGQVIEIALRSRDFGSIELEWLRMGSRPLYLLGRVEYRDAFDESHALEFCERVDWTEVTAPVTYPEGPHNMAD